MDKTFTANSVANDYIEEVARREKLSPEEASYETEVRKWTADIYDAQRRLISGDYGGLSREDLTDIILHAQGKLNTMGED